ncbi:sugar-phosphatase [Arachidicoccus rhizosphaerae]|uniref:Sugar-phosphatase n=1 Tax=Arachidicoccus rhizosphaerae TaxID=551991 RepID=A0A1H3WWR1_9BACT|nr:hexitol phosphatase HxpB [Arachidicoccus rhizosphaerae]SDZ91579.1 sugar-phosphatase [Arachidicoccus rhizosphaerae]
MHLSTVIFDMDGLLIDSEPLWKEAAQEIFAEYGITLSDSQYATTTGLRTKEFVEWWLSRHQITATEYDNAEAKILAAVMDKVDKRGLVMPGVNHIFEFFSSLNFKIGIASSSSLPLIHLVVNKLGIGKYLHAIASAGDLPHGKPHPQVYLNCARTLETPPTSCICFEDSFNGMIAVKAARMRCVIVPGPEHYKEERWAAADLKLSSLQNFNQLHLNLLDN